jgi:hypothetical protein
MALEGILGSERRQDDDPILEPTPDAPAAVEGPDIRVNDPDGLGSLFDALT